MANAIRNYNPDFDEKLLKEAYYFGRKAHWGQKRASGEPYFSHPCEVALIAARELKLDLTSVIVSLLHDVAEDTDFTIEDIREKFGNNIAENVIGVTKLSKRYFSSPSARAASNFRKMIIAMAKDIRVILVKLCDRLHNMRTLKYLNEEKRKRIASDTLEIYAPLAHRLGINKVYYELEDLSLRYLDAEFYKSLKKQMTKKRKEREAEIIALEQQIVMALKECQIVAEIQGRPKHFYSIYTKMKDKHIALDSLDDLVGIRIVTKSVDACYSALGLLHKNWRPVPNRFKDYIAVPKSNNYQSLHTTLIHQSGEPFEVQIRTEAMHEIAERGVAAHWEYKVKEGKMNVDIKKTYAWLQQLIEWYQDVHNAGEFMNTVKLELFSKLVFCFTPAGDIFELRQGATPLDFAYHVHTEVGNRCKGAKVNGNIVPLNYELKNGDIVKIITSKNPKKPPSNWLNLVKTPTAIKKIRAALKREMRDEYIAKGVTILQGNLRKLGATSEQVGLIKSNRFLSIAQKLGFSSSTELFLGVGNGELNPTTILSKIFPDLEVEEDKEKKPKKKIPAKTRKTKSPSCVLVNGDDSFLVRISKCCHPVPGDGIVGYITKGKGVSVHRHGCTNLQYHLNNEMNREVSVEWTAESFKAIPGNKEVFQFSFTIETKDKPGILTTMTKIISGEGINIVSMKAFTKGPMGYLVFHVQVQNLLISRRLIKLISKQPDVYKAYRID
ncbi:RelA/SpoT family protein [Candidatus Riflebacteria bacterium]